MTERPTVRELAKWAEADPERRKAVMRQIDALQAIAGGKPAALYEQAVRLVYARRAKPAPPAATGPLVWIWGKSLEARLRFVARGEQELESLVRDRVTARTRGEAQELLLTRHNLIAPNNIPKREIILEADILERLERMRELLAIIPDPLGFAPKVAP